MGSVINQNKCPHCGTEGSLTTDYNYKTGEESGICTKCGMTYIHVFERDNNGHFRRNNILYSGNEVYFIVKDSQTNKILFKKKFNEIKDITREMIFDFLNRKTNFGEETEKLESDSKIINESLFGNGKPVKLWLDGYASIYHEKNGESKKIFYHCDDLEIQDENLIIKETIIKDESHDGNGIFFILNKCGVGTYNPIEKMTLEEAENAFNEILLDSKNNDIDTEKSYGTWFNYETNQLVELKKRV